MGKPEHLTAGELSGVAEKIDSLLAIVEEHLHDQVCSNGEEVHDGAYYAGLELSVQAAREAAQSLSEALEGCGTAKATDPELFQNLARLTPDQREIVEHLVYDIASKEVRPVNVATAESARIALARFEAEVADLAPEQCASGLAAYDFDVAMEMTSPRGVDMCPGQPGYVVSHPWTLKGLRFALARERFLETITCNVEVAHAE